MGGKKIFDFVKKHAKNAIVDTTIESVKGNVVIDTSQVLHMFGRSINKKSPNAFKDANGDDTSHIYTIMTTVSICLKNNIIPINVFDGPSPDIKRSAIECRIKKTLNAEKELDELINEKNKSGKLSLEDEARLAKLRSKCYRLTRKKIDDCCRLLKLIGLPHMIAYEEADPQCSMLQRYKKLNISGVVGEDSDLLAFGSEVVYRNFGKPTMQTINLNKILEETKLSFNEFIDLFIFSGVEYCKNLTNVGIEQAFNFYKEIKNNNQYNISDANIIPGFDSLDEKTKNNIINDESYHNFLKILIYIKKNKSNIKIHANYLENFIETKDRYTKTSMGKDPTNFNMEWNHPSFKKIRDMLTIEFNFSENYVLSFIQTIEKYYNNYSKPNIINFNKINNLTSFNSISGFRPHTKKNSLSSYQKKINRINYKKHIDNYNNYIIVK